MFSHVHCYKIKPRLYNVPKAAFRSRGLKRRRRNSAKHCGDKSRGRGAPEEAEKSDTLAVISPKANSSEFRKLSVTQQFLSGLDRPHSAAAPGSEGGWGLSSLGGSPDPHQPPPELAAFKPCRERHALPSHDFILFSGNQSGLTCAWYAARCVVMGDPPRHGPGSPGTQRLRQERAGGRRGEVEVAETRLLRGERRPLETALQRPPILHALKD